MVKRDIINLHITDLKKSFCETRDKFFNGDISVTTYRSKVKSATSDFCEILVENGVLNEVPTKKITALATKFRNNLEPALKEANKAEETCKISERLLFDFVGEVTNDS